MADTEIHLVTTYLRNHQGDIEPVVAEVEDGLVQYEGCIILGTLEQVRQVNVAGGTRGLGIIGEQFRWPDGKVPFVRPGDPVLVEVVREAIAHWEERTPIRFPERTAANELRFPNYLTFQRVGGCRSAIGMQGGPQMIFLGPGCGKRQAIHEIGHALGLFHEQSRADRDDFIEVLLENIQPGREFNFRKHVNDGSLLGAYDYQSIMHYRPNDFAIRSDLVTLRSKTTTPIAPSDTLSHGDVASIKLLYPNLPWS
jgi:astacin